MRAFVIRPSTLLTACAVIGAAFTPLACGTSNVASQVKPNAPTANEAMGGADLDCKQGSYAEPLVIDLPADKRVDLESQMNAGVAIVRYDCNQMQVLKDCNLAGKYAFAGVSLKEQVISLQNEDELKANLPFSSGSVGGEIQTGSQLDLALIMIGKRSTAAKVARPVLEGSQCGDATHFVRAATIGAFAMKTGTKGRVAAAVELFGAGTSGQSSADEKRANKDGDISSCKSSKPSSDAPPDQCQSAIRVELVPIAAELPAAKKDGEKKDGEKKEDTAKKDAKPLENPCGAEGFVMVGGKCSRADSGAAHLCNPSDSDDCKAQCDKGDMGSCHNYAEAVFANFCNDPSKKQVCDETNGAENDKREAEAVGYWRQACDKGDIADACDQIGNYLLTGFKLVKADKPVALAALDKGCQLGKADSCFLLGDSYLKGDEGLKKDTMKGLGLVDRACKLGDQYSCQKLGEYYFKGEYLSKDPARGYEFLGQFCAQGEWETCQELGEHLLGIFDKYDAKMTGVNPVKEVPRANELGRELLDRACSKGKRDDACARLGHVYYVEQKWELARKYLPTGCKGDGDTCLRMADMELNGKGGPKDKASAVEFWIASVDDKYMAQAAEALEKGDGLPKNVERAAELWGKLCNSENKPACSNAKRLDKKVWLAAIADDCSREDEWSCSELKSADKTRHREEIDKLCGGASEFGCKELKKLDGAAAKKMVEANCSKEKADKSDDDKDSCKTLESIF
ncbi:MAG: tetratricopeptide repeat protein [Polyangiaceae bacterium]